jgi:hypothetical protein|tara:strand:- start:533 stop:661 length:129 start_codon:yes stop_codon:yes gene_type:complete
MLLSQVVELVVQMEMDQVVAEQEAIVHQFLVKHQVVELQQKV